ncbi:MAG TPA: VRR-NUC domain-containing protein [Steroidobacteraceae bacterium]|nr:VRR-NUC domain-containing protein [Steroidobacteraceae bacterium]
MPHPRPFYYLENFNTALGWLRQRYGGLLNETEAGFIERFQGLPLESSALLVRMLGRRGDLFRTDKLRYEEIGCARAAATALIDTGWVDGQPVLTVAELGRVLRKGEVERVFAAGALPRHARKAELLMCIEAVPLAPRRLVEWWPDAPDVVYRVVVKPLCDRLRLLFFGNFHQDWSEFVLTDLGIFKYEQVARDAATRAFQTREHIDTFHALFECRQQLEEGNDLATVVESLPPPVVDNEWLEGRRRKLQFQIAQCYEQQKDLARALAIYRDCQYAGARIRSVRSLERLGEIGSALQLAALVRERPADEVEDQQIGRMWPRLQRKAGVKTARTRRPQDWPTFQLVLPVTERPQHLEGATGEALSTPEAPVHYVENGLLNSLFGLLCWQAIFAPVAGAFFHEFQAAPADLHAPDFRGRRELLFAQCFEQLESDAYRDTICRNFQQKQGIQSPFVFWGVMSEALLSVALSCLPRRHLKACFARILSDIRANRCGLPDLVQFWPEERRYRLIEVKGPGDRLQDNQIRWLTFCVAHDIPVSVCHVSWDMGNVRPDSPLSHVSGGVAREPSPVSAASAVAQPASSLLSASAGERV